jgi:hypothetical protein
MALPNPITITNRHRRHYHVIMGVINGKDSASFRPEKEAS